MDDIVIIENTEKAKEEHGYQWGYDEIELTQEMINALNKGKCLAYDDGEYMHFISLKKC